MRLSAIAACAALALSCAAATAGAQAPVTPRPDAPRLGVLAGWNSATVSGSDLEGNETRRNGLVLGAYLVRPFGTSGFALRPELLYSQKGTGLDLDDGTEEARGSVAVSYVDVPVLLEFAPPTTARVRPFVHAGPSFGLRTGCAVEGEGDGVSVSLDCDAFNEQFGEDAFLFRRFDLGAVIGGGLRFPLLGRAATVGVRFQQGLTDVLDETNVRNRVLSLHGSIEFPIGRR